MNKEAKRRLLDGLNACRAIEQFVAGCTFEEYEGNLMLRSAIVSSTDTTLLTTRSCGGSCTTSCHGWYSGWKRP
jgi:hypothetical protein